MDFIKIEEMISQFSEISSTRPSLRITDISKWMRWGKWFYWVRALDENDKYLEYFIPCYTNNS